VPAPFRVQGSLGGKTSRSDQPHSGKRKQKSHMSRNEIWAAKIHGKRGRALGGRGSEEETKNRE